MKIHDEKVKELLLREQYVSEEDWAKAEQYARAHHSLAVDYLIEQGIISRDLLGQAIAEFFEVPFSNLQADPPTHEHIVRIPEQVGKKFRVVLVAEDDKNVAVATDNPTAGDLLAALKTIFPKRTIRITYALPDDVGVALQQYRQTLETRFAQILKESQRVAPEIIEEIFADAFFYRASDIHFEPQEQEIIIRFRIDGVLHEAGSIAREYYENIVNRIKVQAHLRIDEHFGTQDGAIRYRSSKGDADMRVSIVPTLDGEKIVIRLLSHYVRDFMLADLGISPANQTLLEQAIHKPYGMIMVVGPTGSGKTTTLYALIKLLNSSDVNITTIEDPVEYKITGINQIQVNNDTELTFSNGLRSIVRQDPNIILVGEIRDRETAEIAVNAALTGHLLFSTFHANDAATAIVRLLHMGTEPFLLASTLELVVAQRLVRKICDHCRYSYQVKPDELAAISPVLISFFTKETTLYRGRGCSKCGGTGFNGRTGIFEFIRITPELQNLMLQNPSAQQIARLSKEQGTGRPLFEDGIEEVKSGITTIEELLRVANPLGSATFYGKSSLRTRSQ